MFFRAVKRLLSLKLHVAFAIINQALNQNFAVGVFAVHLLIPTIIPFLNDNIANTTSFRQVLVEYIFSLQLVS